MAALMHQLTRSDASGAAAAPRPSATLVLLRPASAGVEVLLLRRPPAQDFGNAFVFPGGCVEHQDEALASRCIGLSDAQASAQLGLASGGLLLWAAAIRECFEESGLLLACDRAGQPYTPGSALELSRLSDYRHLVLAGTLTLQEMCREEGLYLAAGQLQYFSYWITPVQAARRYATRFFAAPAPAMQVARHDGKEALEARWLAPRAALTGHGLDLRPPTRNALAHFDGASSVTDALARAAACATAGVTPVLPVLEPGSQRVLLPGDADYPTPAEAPGDD
jgi:8-oxo-dGTP pyrophosphatase MutT (NUDIX family)